MMAFFVSSLVLAACFNMKTKFFTNVSTFFVLFQKDIHSSKISKQAILLNNSGINYQMLMNFKMITVMYFKMSVNVALSF